MNFIKKLIGILLLIVTQLSAKIDGQEVGCGGTYSNLSGIISSQNYSSNYNNYMACTYYIQVPPPNSVNISFISFTMQSCCGWLQVRCISGSTKPVQSFSGIDLPPFLSISSCYTVELVFYTDNSGVAQGFSLRYDIGNGLQGGLTMKPMDIYVRNDLTEPIVLSCSSRANQPDVYPWWSYSSDDYYNPYVEILTTSNCSVSSSLFFLNPEYFSTTSQYSSRTCNLTISRSSFPASTGIYTCTDSTLDFSKALITDCGGMHTGLSGIISSPNYPSSYDNYMDCTYYIQSSPPYSVNITFISFATESCCDYLQVSCPSDSTKPVQRFSGTDLPPFLSISSCYIAQLLFHTNNNGVAKGFSLRYDIGNGLQGGLTMRPMNLNVRSDSTEPIVLSCSSRANQPDVYPWWSYNSNDYPYIYVEILTTSNCSVSSSLRSLNPMYFSTTRQYSSRTCNLTISRSHFPSAAGMYTCTDSTLESSNALITFSDCGETHTGLSGIISSPNYPSEYSNNLNCYYYIQSSSPNSVNITFISFVTELDYDWLQVSCSSDSTKPVQRFSGTNVPPFLSISSCYNVQLLFHTDNSKVLQGFSLRYDIENAGTGSSLDSAPLLFHTNGLVIAQEFSLRYDTGNETGNNNLNTLALIVGVVVGIVVLLIVVAIVVFFCLRRKKLHETPDPSATTNVDPQNDNLYEMCRRNTQHANEGENSTYETLNYDTRE